MSKEQVQKFMEEAIRMFFRSTTRTSIDKKEKGIGCETPRLEVEASV